MGHLNAASLSKMHFIVWTRYSQEMKDFWRDRYINFLPGDGCRVLYRIFCQQEETVASGNILQLELSRAHTPHACTSTVTLS